MSPQQAAKAAVNPLVRLWKWSGERHTSLRTASIIFVLGCFAFLTLRQNDNDQAAAQLALVTYQAEVTRYQGEHDAWELCLTASKNRDTARESDFAYVAYVENVLAIISSFNPIPGDLQGQLNELAENRRAEINEMRPPLDPAECGSEPERPAPLGP